MARKAKAIPEFKLRQYHGKENGAKRLAELYDCHIQSVYKRWQKMGLTTQPQRPSPMFNRVTKNPPQPKPKPVLVLNPSPPSPAALRLAEFDPVVARALRARNGEDVQMPHGWEGAGFVMCLSRGWSRKKGEV